MSRKVEFLNLRCTYEEVREEVEPALLRSVASGRYIGGPEVEAFEGAFARYCGAAHCVGVGNGLDALHLSLKAMGVGAGDEVIVSSNGYIATWLAVSMAGAVPVPVEPLPSTHNLDPDRVEQAITPRTKVILPTHLYGQAADMDPILEIAAARGCYVLEDAAQAHGARYKERRVGAHGHAVAWSFYPSKNLGAFGDAGAVTTNDAALAERVRVLGNYGSSVRYVNEVRGINSRLDPLQAAVLLVKLKHLDRWNESRSRTAQRYTAGLQGLGLALPAVPQWADPAWHLYVVRSPQRDRLQAALKEAGVETLIHYPIPPYRQKAYSDLHWDGEAFPIADELAGEVLSLPIGPHMAAEEVDYVIETVRRFADGGCG
jgi:dTDP-4-amino-4,6-dideoxygalactose transaminase